MPRLCALARHWAHAPPPQQLLCMLVKALLGIAERTPGAAADRDAWQALHALAADPNSGISIRGTPPR